MSDLVTSLWNALLDLPEHLQLLVLIVASYVEEDVTTIGASLMYSEGKIVWWVCFLGAFGGIWVGDIINYMLGRFIGKPMLNLPGLRRLKKGDRLQRYEASFHEGHTKILFLGRFLPSARFPVQFSAGLVRLHFSRFVYITTLAALAWTPCLIGITLLVGPAMLNIIKPITNNPLLGVFLSICLLYIMVRMLSLLSNPYWKAEIRSKFLRMTRWEFWPPWLFYIPIAIHYLFHSLRTGRPTLPTLTNPGMDHGGFLGESKSKIMASFQGQDNYMATTIALPSSKDWEARVQEFDEHLQLHSLHYPVILKPDVGQRGAGVRVIPSKDEATEYLKGCSADLVLQEYIEGPIELGIFYYRDPGEDKGHILSVTRKEFPSITGDGKHTIHKLIAMHPRARYQAPMFFRRHADKLDQVLAAGETLQLVSAGNHCQGTTFLDGMEWMTEALEQRIDAISKTFDGFYFGRYDLRGNSLQAIQAGEGFKIIELNGVTSEATHIYNPECSLWEAYRVLRQQWNIAWRIGETVQRETSLQPSSIRTMIGLLFHYRRLANSYPDAS